jgi:hypothetical protein
MLTQGKGSVQLTSTHQPVLYSYYALIKLSLAQKLNQLSKKVNRTEPSPSVSITTTITTPFFVKVTYLSGKIKALSLIFFR